LLLSSRCLFVAYHGLVVPDALLFNLTLKLASFCIGQVPPRKSCLALL
jgi:hypothetical protein